MKIAILGIRGQLGAVMPRELHQHELVLFDHAALDITDAAAAESALGRLRPDVIINCTGYNAVDAAEDDPVAALRVNAFAVRTLARVARATGAILVHYGSDFVFDGLTEQPHREDDAPNPRGAYATSKMLGEWLAADAPRSYVLRVESLFGRYPDGPPDKGSVAMIVKGLRAGSGPKVFEDRTVSPTYVIDAARATRELIERELPFGLYHCVNSGICTWLEFALEAARLLGVEPRVEPVRLADMTLKAPRPLYCALSNAKLASVGITMPTWQEALAHYLEMQATGSGDLVIW